MEQQNHYATLSIDRCASCAEIKRAYRLLAHRFHPDVSDDLDGERKFKDVSEAYRTLKQPESRAAYDHRIRNFCGDTKALRPAGQADMSIFDYGFDHGFLLWSPWQWLWSMSSGNSSR